MTPQWAQHLNPILGISNMSVFTFLTNIIGRLNNIAEAPTPTPAVESVLAVMMTEGLSRTGNTATSQGTSKGFY